MHGPARIAFALATVVWLTPAAFAQPAEVQSPPAAEEANPPAEEPSPPAAAPPAKPKPAPRPDEVIRPRLRHPTHEEVGRELERMGEVPEEQRAAVWQELARRLAAKHTDEQVEHAEPVVPFGAALSEPEIVQRHAQIFVRYLIAGDARGMLRLSALPFQLEDRRFDDAELLLQEWLKQLRTKRIDLLELYGIEALTPAEMEKKHGRPPSRLRAVPWRGSGTYVAVANLSGHAAILVLKDMPGLGWRVVAYHD